MCSHSDKLMTQEKIFKQVSVSDSPKEFGIYLTDKGELKYSPHKEHSSIKHEWFTLDNRAAYPEWWIKIDNDLSDVPTELLEYLSETFRDISNGNGAVKNIMQYGGSLFIKFDNDRTYKMSIELYRSDVCLDNHQ